MGDVLQHRTDLDFYAELLPYLSSEAVLIRLLSSAFTTGKLPEASLMIRVESLGNEQFAPVKHEGSRYLNDRTTAQCSYR